MTRAMSSSLGASVASLSAGADAAASAGAGARAGLAAGGVAAGAADGGAAAGSGDRLQASDIVVRAPAMARTGKRPGRVVGDVFRIYIGVDGSAGATARKRRSERGPSRRPRFRSHV